MAEPTFSDRMFLGAESVMAAIERGEIQGADAVTAALHEAQLDASTDEPRQ
ncbi:hypothetical protein [Streptomyces kaempferi]|uniref:Uncharacterized protein n=1 Tax=Streptomyces kaempferi TaxID=333725 RepID=A0ABW3XMD1_9ACTN